MSSKNKKKPRFVTLEANFKDGPYPDSVSVNKETGNLEINWTAIIKFDNIQLRI